MSAFKPQNPNIARVFVSRRHLEKAISRSGIRATALKFRVRKAVWPHDVILVRGDSAQVTAFRNYVYCERYL